MGKKDLLERLTRAPGEAPRTRRKPAKETPAPARKATGAPVQRVGNRVLRRTRRGEGASSAPPAEESQQPEAQHPVRKRSAGAESDAATDAPEERLEAVEAAEPTSDGGGNGVAAEEALESAAEPVESPAPKTETETVAVQASKPVEEPSAPAEPEASVAEAAAEPPADASPESTPEPIAAAQPAEAGVASAEPAEATPTPEPSPSAVEAAAAPSEPSEGEGAEAVEAAPTKRVQAEAPESTPASGSAESARPTESVVPEPESAPSPSEAPAAPAAVAAAAAAAPSRAAESAPRRVVGSRYVVRRRKREPATTRPATPPPATTPTPPPAAEAKGERSPPGLGSAVVVPPPDYDPANPNAYRRQQEATPAPAPAAPGAAKQTRGRRRVEPGGGGGGDYRGRGRRNSGGRGGRGYDRRPRRKTGRKSGPKQASPAPKASKRKVRVDNVISVRDLGMQLGVKATIVLRQLMDLGMMVNVNDMLDIETAALVAAEFEYEVENVGFQEQNYLENVEEAVEEGNLQERPPVVTIMGHVDHGKTTLLDTIRSSRVAAGEAGGITQHIGAYQVEHDGQPITFIDTPGHEAFSAMRARGAGVTDIVVLVVAADDGVQPQTEEAIQHARAAEVPIIVAVNKMDKPGVTAEPIMTRMSEYELVPEEWGGDTLYVPISALKNEGIDSLLEAIILQAEVVDTRANPDRFAEGIVLEAKMERGRGAVASVLVQHGTLKRGDHVVLGSAFGKVRAMLDSAGGNLKVAGPSTPVELFGLSELPEVGDTMNSVKSEKNARTLAEHRAVAKRQEAMASRERRDINDLYAKAAEAQTETLLLILKADVGGSLQAVKAAVEDIEVDGAQVRILLSSVGDINESDVNLAASDNARLIGFNVKVDARARKAAQQLGVEPELYGIIYEVLDRVEREMKGLLAPVYELVREGTIEVRQLFRISRIGTVAGSYVIDGKVGRNHKAKVLRNGKEIWEGDIDTLKRFKDDVKEVASGYECGVSLQGFDELEVGDLIETYSEQVVEPT